MSGYNGWSNYETWCVGLWLTNEQGSEMDVREETSRSFNRTDDSAEACRLLADWLQGYVEDCAPKLSGLFSDLQTHALGAVDWRELADTFLSDECGGGDGYESQRT